MQSLLKKLLLFSVLILATSPLRSSAAGIGMSPARIVNDRLLPDSNFTQEVTLSRGDSARSSTLAVTIPASIAPFVTLAEGQNITIPVGTQNYPIHIIVHIPKDGALKTYQGTILFTVVQDSSVLASKGSTATTQLQLALPISLTVQAKQITEYAVSDIAVAPMEAKQPFTLFYNVDNTGNVSAQPKTISVQITDLKAQHTYLDKTYTIASDPVAPFTYQLQSFATPVDLATGQYWATIVITDKEHTIEAKRKLALSVVAAGSNSVELTATQATVANQVVTVPLINHSTRFVAAELVNEVYDDSNKIIATVKKNVALRPNEQLPVTNQFNNLAAGTYTIKSTIQYLNQTIAVSDATLAVKPVDTTAPSLLQTVTSATSTSNNKAALMQRLLVVIVLLSGVVGGVVWYIKRVQ